MADPIKKKAPHGRTEEAERSHIRQNWIARMIEKDIEEVTIDGVKMVFQNTPGTEAPAEMNTWFPEFKAFWAAENITGTVHNIYTLRGALIRHPLLWSKKINEALYLFGQEAGVMFSSHNWPRWGNDRIQEVMRTQRDIYANLNNEVLHLANKGVTINEAHNFYKPPESQDQVKAGKAMLKGNPEPLKQLMSLLVEFTPDFEIMPGTACSGHHP